MRVTERFEINQTTKNIIANMEPDFGFNGVGAVVFYRSYSRDLPNGKKESWNDVVLRVMNGVFSIRKDWYIKNGIKWDDRFWQDYAHDMAISMFNMEWLPPGRGLWAMGTDYIYERGSMALNNCGFKVISNEIGKDCEWIMDALMSGVGVGFHPERDDRLEIRRSRFSEPYTVPDTREGWASSTRQLIDSYLGLCEFPDFDYSQIRGKGERIKGFGGISSGPKPLIDLHKKLIDLLEDYDNDSLKLKTDIANLIGVAVVSGNIRRSAEIACAPINDPTFMDLKDYSKYPYRMNHGYMSNNSVYLRTDADFEMIGEVARRVVNNGEPGLINLKNLPLGRLDGNEYPVDKAVGFNPCGEQPLEDGECCCLAEILPTRGGDFCRSAEYATVYATTVTLLPTHSELTNAVMLRNRRIGISITDVSGFNVQVGTTAMISELRRGYEIVRETNNWLSDEAGVPRAIRVTTIKPGGSVPKVAGKTGGYSWPTFRHSLFRINIAKGSSICEILDEAKVPYEPNIYDPNTLVYEFPVLQGPAKPATEVSLWQQAATVALLQRHWSDNAVSNTLYFKPRKELVKTENPEPINGIGYINEQNTNGTWEVYKINPDHEENIIEEVLAIFISQVKSLSLLPHTPDGVYQQSPQSGITPEEYEKRIFSMGKFDWSKLRADYEVAQDLYCQGDKCELPNKVGTE
jgi:ribonucleoside-triphosphate reductase